MDKYFGRTALVTGAARGIGAAVSRKLVRLGLTVFGCDKDEERLVSLKKEIESGTDSDSCSGGEVEIVTSDIAVGTDLNKPSNDDNSAMKTDREVDKFQPVICDLQKEEDILAMFKMIKVKSRCVDICVMSAGVGHKALLLEGETWMFRNMFEVNVLSTVLCAKESVRLMKEANVDDGHLVIINSGAGHKVRVGQPDYVDFNFYNATKFALTAVTEGLRYELRLRNSNIRISQISPGLVQTNFTHSMYPDDGHIIDLLYNSVKCLQPDDVADAVVHVLSRPANVQIHDVYIDTKDSDRPVDWEKKVKKLEKERAANKTS